MAKKENGFQSKLLQKNKVLEKKWGNVWDYFSPQGFEDILICKIFELKDAKTREMKIDECDDIIRYTEKYKKELETGKWLNELK